MNKGWIKLWEETIYHPVWRDDPVAWRIFEYLLISSYRGNPQGTTVKTTQQIADACLGGSGKNGTCYKAIKRLEKHGMVKTKSSNKRTEFKITNWWKYQGNGSAGKNEVKTQQKHSNTLYKNKIKNKEDINVNANASTRDFFYELVKELGYTETTLYTDARRKKLQARLKKFSKEQLLTVSKAIYNSPFHQGDNPSGKRYGTIDFLLRSDEKIDEWLQADTKKITYKADW